MEKNRTDQKINLWRVFQIAATCSLAITYVFQWGKMISIPSERTGADFIAFYAVGRIAQDQGISSVYKVNAQHDIEQIVVGFNLAKGQVLLYNHMPYLIPLLKLLVNADYIDSFIRWVVLMIGIYVAGSIFFLNSISSTEKNKVYSILMMGMLTFFSVFPEQPISRSRYCLTFSRHSFVVCWNPKKEGLACRNRPGFNHHSSPYLSCIGYTAVLQISPSMVAILCHRRASALASILMLGRQGTLDFINLLRISASGTWYGMNESAMVNMIGLILRTFPFIEPGSIRVLAGSDT